MLRISKLTVRPSDSPVSWTLVSWSVVTAFSLTYPAVSLTSLEDEVYMEHCLLLMEQIINIYSQKKNSLTFFFFNVNITCA